MLNTTDSLIGNQNYTFRFQSDGLGNPTDDDLRSRVLSANLPIANVVVARGLFSSVVTVSFTMNSGVAWQVVNMYQSIEGALDSGLGNYTFIDASTGTSIAHLIPPEFIFIGMAVLIVIIFVKAFADRAASKVI